MLSSCCNKYTFCSHTYIGDGQLYITVLSNINIYWIYILNLKNINSCSIIVFICLPVDTLWEICTKQPSFSINNHQWKSFMILGAWFQWHNSFKLWQCPVKTKHANWYDWQQIYGTDRKRHLNLTNPFIIHLLANNKTYVNCHNFTTPY